METVRERKDPSIVGTSVLSMSMCWYEVSYLQKLPGRVPQYVFRLRFNNFLFVLLLFSFHSPQDNVCFFSSVPVRRTYAFFISQGFLFSFSSHTIFVSNTHRISIFFSLFSISVKIEKKKRRQ